MAEGQIQKEVVRAPVKFGDFTGVRWPVQIWLAAPTPNREVRGFCFVKKSSSEKELRIAWIRSYLSKYFECRFAQILGKVFFFQIVVPLDLVAGRIGDLQAGLQIAVFYAHGKYEGFQLRHTAQKIQAGEGVAATQHQMLQIYQIIETGKVFDLSTGLDG